MRQTQKISGFVHSQAYVKAIACLVLACGGTLPTLAASETLSNPKVENVQQNEVTVKGVVKDANGEAIIGASVIEKGNAKNGTVTDIDGNYTLKVKRGATLTISYIGYVNQETKGGDVTLQEDLKSLNEVVVIGYGTQKKGDITSAITSIKAEDFTTGKVKDAAELIKGKVAGLTIANGSGDPNAESTIRLRGVISLNGSNTPLVLVDGIEGSLSTVAPENIASIDVLKDASAAAIYGTRGANGVIIITTKGGQRESKTEVSYSGYASLSAFAKTLDFMDGADIREGKTDFSDKGYDTDWLDAITRTAFSHNHNVLIHGGNKTTTYSADFTYRKDEGVFLDTYNENMKASFDLSHWMLNDMVKIQVNLLKTWHENGPIDAAGQMLYRQAIIRNPTEPIYNADGSYCENFGVNYYYNPLGIIKEHKGQYKTETTRYTGSLTFEPIKGWQTKAMFSTDSFNNHDQTYYTSKYYSQASENHTGYASQNYATGQTDNFELTSNFNHQFGEHRFNALAGYSYQKDTWYGFSGSNYDYPTDMFEYNNMYIGAALKNGKAGLNSYKSESKLIGFFGRISYGYADRYNILVSVRHEGSSKFGANHKWGTFPSASLGWTISNEKFMKDVKWVNNLKLRAGFGVTGVIPNDPYQSLTRWTYGSSSINPTYYYDNNKWNLGLIVNSNPNPDLKWEKSTEFNIGLDWSILGERLSGTIDVYKKTTKDMLWWYDVPTPPNYYKQTLANVGEMRNQGIEASVTAIPVQTKDFEYKTTVTVSHNSNKLISLSNDLYETANQRDEAYLGEPISISTQRLEVGKSIGNFYGMKSVGVSENGLWMIENVETGEAEEFKDNMLSNDKYRQYLGNALPKVYMGWTNAFRYKNFDLSLQFTGQFGFKILNEARCYYENNSIAYNRLKSANDEPYGCGYKLSSAQKQTFVSYYLENGDFLKLSSATLAYNVPLKENKYVKAARVYLSGTNLFTITGYKGLDPELTNSDVQASGIDWRDKYPSIRTFTLGVNLTF
ncbi:MAG TPA: TonB-dependent receptor [Prevotella sp.]|nr:TonB-dependent receptor [Prevotella sp.]